MKSLRLIALGASAFVLSLTATSQNKWKQITNYPGPGVEGAVSFSIGNLGFMGCGQEGASNAYSNLSSGIWCWNRIDSAWSTYTTFPGGNRYAPVAFTLGSKFFIGTGWNGSGCSNDLWMYDTVTKVWTSEASFPGTACCEAFSFVIGHNAYVGTGSDGGSPYLNQVWQYNIDSNKWTQKNNFPGSNSNRTGAVAFTLGSFAYAGSGGLYGDYSDCWKYNPFTDTWTAITNFPGSARAHAVATVINGTAIFGSGRDVSGNVLRDFWAFDTVTQTWSSIDSLPGNSRTMATAFSVGNIGYVGTGCDGSYNPYTDVWQYAIPQINYQISGVVYVDKKGTCVYDSTADTPLANITMKAVHNGKVASIAVTNYKGLYCFNFLNPSIHYSIEMDSASSSAYSATCPLSGIIDTVPTATNINFALNCTRGFDLTGILAACIDTPFIGQSEVSACIYNARCKAVNGSLKLVLDSAFSISSVLADSMPQVSGDTLSWNFNNLGPEGNQYLCVLVRGTVSLPPGDSIKVTFIATPIAGDSVPGNNIITYWVHVWPHNCIGVPFDPNEKSVSPVGDISPTQRLTYNIKFQNTGTAVAHNVVVMDTLSPYVDPATLQIINSSAPMTTDIINGHILEFTFNNIMLPDTATSKIASIGDVTYSIMPITGVTDGTDIQNRADIYFDVNPAILTNTTHSPIVTTLTAVATISNNGNVTCFPNPFSNKITILYSVNQNSNVNISVYNMLGDKVSEIVNKNEKAGTYSIDWASGNLSAGVYLLRYVINGEASTQKLILTK